MTARAADSRHSRQHQLLAGCLLLSLLVHAALLARWSVPITATAPASVSALRVTLDTTTARAEPALTAEPKSNNRGQPRTSQKDVASGTDSRLKKSGEASGSNSRLARKNVTTKKFERREAAPDAPILEPPVHVAQEPEHSSPPLISAGEETPVAAGSATHLAGEEGDTAGAIAAAVQLELARHFHYPPLAARRGWQGQVVLAFRVGVDGAIEAAHVAHSSGHALLDRAALGALGKVHKIALQRTPLRAPLELQLPVIYRLEES